MLRKKPKEFFFIMLIMGKETKRAITIFISFCYYLMCVNISETSEFLNLKHAPRFSTPSWMYNSSILWRTGWNRKMLIQCLIQSGCRLPLSGAPTREIGSHWCQNLESSGSWEGDRFSLCFQALLFFSFFPVKIQTFSK